MRIGAVDFDEIVFCDFEFTAPAGATPTVICMVTHELVNGITRRYWTDDLNRLAAPPFPVDRRALFVAYYSSAEFSCHLAMNWPLPENVLDLYVEFRNLTNGKTVPYGSGLLGALAYLALDPMSALDKEGNRGLAIRGARSRLTNGRGCSCTARATSPLW